MREATNGNECYLHHQEMVLDKTPEGGLRPRYLMYDIVQFEVSSMRLSYMIMVCVMLA